MSKRFIKFFGFVLVPVALLAAFALAKGEVIIDGTTFHVRVITQGGVPYVAAPDMAKALGKFFQVHNGTLVFGAPGGRNPEEAAVVEYGKWGFNGVIRMRVTDFNPSDKGCGDNSPASVGFELANATKGNITFTGTGRLTGVTHQLGVSASKEGSFLGNNWGTARGVSPIPPNIPPAQHAKTRWCAGFSGTPDLLTVSTGQNDGWGNFKPAGATMKFKLTKEEKNSR